MNQKSMRLKDLEQGESFTAIEIDRFSSPSGYPLPKFNEVYTVGTPSNPYYHCFTETGELLFLNPYMKVLPCQNPANPPE
jgi:hypothetical protein